MHHTYIKIEIINNKLTWSNNHQGMLEVEAHHYHLAVEAVEAAEAHHHHLVPEAF